MGVSKAAAVPVLLVLSTLLPYLSGNPSIKAIIQKEENKINDMLLFFGPFFFHAFLILNAIFSSKISSDLSLVVLTISVVNLFLLARAAGLIHCVLVPEKSDGKRSADADKIDVGCSICPIW